MILAKMLRHMERGHFRWCESDHFEMVQAGVNKAGTLDVTKIAYALEGLAVKDFLGYDAVMRKDDHQINTVYHVGTFQKAGVKYDSEGTGLGWKTSATVLAKDVEQPTSCKMKRPAIK